MRASLAWVLFLAAAAEGQPRIVTGYYQNVPLLAGETELFPGGFMDFNRLRFTGAPSFGSFAVEVAYEQVLTLRENAVPAGSSLGAVPGGGEWLDLQWTLEEPIAAALDEGAVGAFATGAAVLVVGLAHGRVVF